MSETYAEALSHSCEKVEGSDAYPICVSEFAQSLCAIFAHLCGVDSLAKDLSNPNFLIMSESITFTLFVDWLLDQDAPTSYDEMWYTPNVIFEKFNTYLTEEE